MNLKRIFPESIPGPAALVYALGPGLVMKRLQKRLADLIDDGLPKEAASFVDVGCGPGWLANEVARRRPSMKVLAVDLSRSMARIAAWNTRKTDNVEVRSENGSKISEPDGSVDMIVSAESMHHWRHPVDVFNEFHRLLRPGGRAWIFDGRDDFTDAEFREWFHIGRRPVPLFIPKAILRMHGFSAREWQEKVPAIASDSRFATCRIDTLGIYRRLALERAR